MNLIRAKWNPLTGARLADVCDAIVPEALQKFRRLILPDPLGHGLVWDGIE